MFELNDVFSPLATLCCCKALAICMNLDQTLLGYISRLAIKTVE